MGRSLDPNREVGTRHILVPMLLSDVAGVDEDDGAISVEHQVTGPKVGRRHEHIVRGVSLRYLIRELRLAGQLLDALVGILAVQS